MRRSNDLARRLLVLMRRDSGVRINHGQEKRGADYERKYVLISFGEPLHSDDGKKGLRMKLIYAGLFALFPLVAAAQTLQDSAMRAAVCNDDHCDDSIGQDVAISAAEVLSIEAILEKYSVIVSRDTDDDLLVSDPDPEDMPVGSIGPRIGTAPAEHAILRVPDDDYVDEEPLGGSDTIASQITAPEPQLENPSRRRFCDY
jgi:hypothetical protein